MNELKKLRDEMEEAIKLSEDSEEETFYRAKKAGIMNTCEAILKDVDERLDHWKQDKAELSNTGIGLTNYGIDCRISELKEIKELLTQKEKEE